MMLLRDGEPAVKAQAKEWPKEPKPVEKPLFSAYKMDRVPDVCAPSRLEEDEGTLQAPCRNDEALLRLYRK